MGFSLEIAKKATIKAKNKGVSDAMEFVLEMKKELEEKPK